MREAFRRFLSWPSRPGNHLVPWCVAARRLAFAPIVYAGLALAFVGLAFGWGMNEAIRFWRNSH